MGRFNIPGIDQRQAAEWEHQYDEELANMELQREAGEPGHAPRGPLSWLRRLVSLVQPPRAT